MNKGKSLLVFGIFGLATVVAFAQGPPPHAKGKHQDRGKVAHDHKDRNPGVFDRVERDIIRAFFRDHSDLPPGLAKRDRLPPGLEKQLRERGSLPPGLQKRIDPLPGTLTRRLPRLPSNIIRGVIGRDVVLVDRERNVILDILEDILN